MPSVADVAAYILADRGPISAIKLQKREERVFGIKDGAILRVLWYDPQHRVCPSPKKNT